MFSVSALVYETKWRQGAAMPIYMHMYTSMAPGNKSNPAMTAENYGKGQT